MTQSILTSTPLNIRPATEDPDEPTPVDGQKIDDPTGATEAQVGDRTGPGAGYDQEPKKDKDQGGVAPS